MNAPTDEVDVCLLLEGTYPFVRGGVATWTHDLIRSLPECRFAIVFIGSARKDYAGPKFEVPPNVVHLECHYLEDAWTNSRSVASAAIECRDLAAIHDAIEDATEGAPAGATGGVLRAFAKAPTLSREAFLHSNESWEYIRSEYQRACPHASFVDYFWTVRAMHGPLFLLADIARKAPRARVYHAVSTGYAGLLGALLARRTKRSFVLTEHGIYTKERKIDLNAAEWIPESHSAGRAGSSNDAIRRLWIQFFEGIGRLAYRESDLVVSLYEGNRERQVADGADRARTRVIPNGIDLDRFARLVGRRSDSTPNVVGFVGRIVPIKDVKTYVRAMRVVCDAIPSAEGWIVGSGDESPAYASQCEELVRNLSLDGHVRFLGHRDVTEILPQLGVLMLTSISEAQPLSLLEAFAAGVPAVTTDVGACRELVHGSQADDVALGAAGSVVPISDPEASARAAISLLRDPDRFRAAQRAGIARAQKHYDARTTIARYRDIYSTVGA